MIFICFINIYQKVVVTKIKKRLLFGKDALN